MKWAINGPAVVVPARVAFLLSRKLPLDDFRDAARGADPELYAVLQAWQGIAHSYQRDATARQEETCGSSVAPTPEVIAPSDHNPLSTQQVATVANVTDRAIRLAAEQRRLIGHKDDHGAWHFQPDDVAFWLSQRTPR